MKNLVEHLRNLGIDGWLFGFSGLAAIIISLISFLGFQIPLEQLLQIILGAIGALMLTVVAASSRRTTEISEIKNMVGTTETRLLHAKDFGRFISSSAINSKSFILDTGLNQGPPVPLQLPYFSGLQGDYKKILYERLRKKEISFRKVEIIPHKERLESVIFRLLLHEGLAYYIRYYEPLVRQTPLIDILTLRRTYVRYERMFSRYFIPGVA